MIVPELLSPVGNFEHLKIAVLSGASSIYLSGKNYGARQYAENFSISEIEEAVQYAHLHNVKVYVTVNTLIKESELKNCLEYLEKLYFIGVDAILVQDIGLVRLVNEYIPNLNIHASTQMKIKNTEELIWAKNAGLSRIVLPRELNLNEIKNMAKKAHELDLEVEIFVHGAQCYSYSGNCLLSSFIGGRSGNRGRCGQPCRQEYFIETINEKKHIHRLNREPEYYLSPKDLNQYNKLEIISKIGVDCIKIEGRMRSSEYIMITTRTYRQRLNHINQKNWKNKDKVIKSCEEELQIIFNRKLSNGHIFNNKSNNIINPVKPSHHGLYIGKIVDYENNNIHIKLKEDLINIPQKGDGILIEGKEKNSSKIGFYGFDISGDPKFKKTKVYWNKNKLIKDKVNDNILIIKKVKENKKESIKIKKDCNVYLTKQNKITHQLKQLLNNKTPPMYKKSVLNISFYIENKCPIIKGTLRLGDGQQIKHKYTTKEPWQKAKNKPISPDIIKKQISKLDDAPYYLESVKVSSIPKNLFVPISELNKIRREFLKQLENKIIDFYIPKKEVIKEYENTETSKNSDELNLSIYLNNLENLDMIDDNLFKRVYYQIPVKNNNLINEDKIDISYCVNEIKKAMKISENKKYDLIWMWPEIMHETQLNNFIKICGILNKTLQIPNIMTNQLGLEDYFKNNFNITLYGDYSLNITNTESIKNLNKFKALTISPELSKEDYINIIRNTSDKDRLELLIFGNIISMISEKNLLSEKLKRKIKNINKPDNKITNLYLVDKNNNKYPVYSTMNTDEVILLYYKDYSIIQYINTLNNEGYSNFSLDLRWKNKNQIKNINNICNMIKNKDIVNLDTDYTISNFSRGLK